MYKFISLFLLISVKAVGAETFDFSFEKADLEKVIAIYSKASGQKIVLDPGVRGIVKIINTKKVSAEEAFNDLCIQLSINGYSYYKQNDGIRIEPARDLTSKTQEVSSTLPGLNPERIATWIYSAKHLKASQLIEFLKLEATKYGQINLNTTGNQLIITDFTSGLNRMAAIIEKTDIPTSK